MRRRARSDSVPGPRLRENLPVLAAVAAVAPARGAIAVHRNRLLLDRLFIVAISSLLFRTKGGWQLLAKQKSSALRNQYVVFLPCWHTVPESHHGVVFMDHVVTVNGIFTQPI